jgi:hypothetical protein
MKKLLVALCFPVAALAAEPPDAWDELAKFGPIETILVTAPTQPTPFLTGYLPETKTCHLLVNTLAIQPAGLEYHVQRTHEAGHCIALRAAVPNAGGLYPWAMRMSEAFADVYTLAWYFRNEPASFEEVFLLLNDTRKVSRRQSSAYDTLLPMNRARALLMATSPAPDPATFTLEMFK